jgi:hypothetical protein
MAAVLWLGGEAFQLLPCGAIHWPARKLLAVADLHLEKGSAAAREGWLVPPYDSLETLTRLEATLRRTGATTVISLGDSLDDAGAPARMAPQTRSLLARLVADHQWIWITGNHDGAAAAGFGGLTVPEWQLSGISFRHIADLALPVPEISGHFHPVARLSGPGAGRRRCFALAGERLVLPAYGSYAGGLDALSRELADALGSAPDILLPSRAGIRRLRPDRSAA